VDIGNVKGETTMAKAAVKATNKTFTNTLKYERETKGTWVYILDVAEGERKSGSNAVYLLKSEYPTRPGETVTVNYTIS
jgi:hypothetical protein